MRKEILSTLLMVAILMTPAIMQSSCGDDTGGAGSTGTASESSKAVSAEDRAARIAAQTQLRNAQMSQEGYFAENGRYASTAADLRTVDQRLNAKLQVVSGSSSDYEMSIEASDSAKTVYIIRRSGSKVVHVDENGNSW
ncbi:MAG: hypothetical protein WC935_08295 [Thermoleophilia bacterium]